MQNVCDTKPGQFFKVSSFYQKCKLPTGILPGAGEVTEPLRELAALIEN